MRKLLFITLVVSIFLSGCCSVLKPSNQDLAFKTTPYGVTVYVDGTAVGETPFRQEFKVKGKHTVKLEKEGYLPYEWQIKKSLDGLYFLNILFPLGFIIDAATGSLSAWTPTGGVIQMKKN